MNTDPETYEEALAAAVAAAEAEKKKQLEREKMRPTVVPYGKGEPLQQAAEKAAVAGLKKLGLRHYPLGEYPLDRLKFGCLAVASQRTHQNFLAVVDKFAGLRDIFLDFKQNRPEPDEGTIPPLPIDLVTGLRVRNPELPLPGTKPNQKARYDYKSQIYIREFSPRLAKWLKDCAANGGQPSFAMVDELAFEKQRADKLRALPYGEREWAENKLRPASGVSETEKEQFVRSIGDPDLAQFHRREAAMGPPKLPFGNLTARMRLAQLCPELLETYKEAEKLFAEWTKAQPKEEKTPVVFDQRGRPRKAA